MCRLFKLTEFKIAEHCNMSVMCKTNYKIIYQVIQYTVKRKVHI